ncbi:hypothetical protein [Candidatus Chloroploca sp. Khr17]|uniref:hypothetical protein n=1 Tax=Candidatus Chloroploca sp. Khr17 TaxID=2496869 RepID=UPI00101C3B6F|nr:hypothetical protein [Candidatus Chloroploca sp. Khr17]
MSTPPTIESLQEHIVELEAELARLRPIEAAAREAYAFFAGRRPGFAPTYPRDIIIAAFAPDPTRSRKRSSGSTRSVKRRKRG